MDEIIQKIKSVLTQPKTFYSKLKEEKIEKPFAYYAALLLVRTIIGGLASAFLGFAVSSLLTGNSKLGSFGLIPLMIIIYILSLLLSFVVVALLHLWIKLFSGKGTYTQTFQLYVYSDTPSLLLGWIPFVSLIARIWGLALLIIGTMEIHKISKTKAILMYVLPVCVLAILGFILAIVGIVAFSALSTLRK